MAHEGELVKMENGRWARFQRCNIRKAGLPDSSEMSILVAVELDERHQDMLSAAEDSLESYRRRGIPVKVELDPGAQGKLHITLNGETAALH